ncbi:MAG: hypothetical protein Q7S08_00345, partial [bacterium]|nr:hypothetical protein [bacterium]
MFGKRKEGTEMPKKKPFLVWLATLFTPSIALAGGGGGLLSSILMTVAIVAVAYFTGGASLITVGEAGVTYWGGVATATLEGGVASLWGLGPVVETMAEVALINGLTTDAIMCVTGITCGGDDGAGVATAAVGSTAGTGSTGATVSTSGGSTGGTGQSSVPGDSCRGALNACNQGYSGTFGYADDGTTLVCYQTNNSVAPIPSTPPPESGCPTTDGSCALTHYDCSAGTSANPVANADSWTWACNGINGGSNASCSEARSWTNYCTGANDQHPWQIWRYDNSTPPNYEYVRTDLSTCGPLSRMDGSCNTRHWGCNTGTSANNTGGSSGPWTWSCNGSNGGLDVSCSQSTGSGGGTGGGTGTSGAGSSSCVVRGGIAQRLCSGSAPGSELVSYNNCGVEVGRGQCTYGCSGGACDPPPPVTFTSSTANAHKGTQTTFTATGHLQVRPALVRQSDPTWVYWNVQNAS